MMAQVFLIQSLRVLSCSSAFVGSCKAKIFVVIKPFVVSFFIYLKKFDLEIQIEIQNFRISI